MLHQMRWLVAVLLMLQGCSARQAPAPKAEHWAVLIAGSNGWWNYRHQSDVLHAYHVLKAKGVKPENMIVMVFDDIANAKYNPFPGKIFNKPNGYDVYTGVPLDYTGKHVSADNVLAVLSGNLTAMANKGSGKVINPGPGDHVFVYYSDHGAPGLICMPEGDDLYADDLHKVLKSRFRDGKHGELVFYLEACESGSMFDGLTTGIDIFATTAANPSESSWAYYCPGDTADPGKSSEPTPDTIGACLGDEYSIHWIEDAEASDLTLETLQQQYTRVKHLTQESHVMHYGRGRIEIEEASNFIGITNLEPPTQNVPEDVQDEEDEEDDDDESMLAVVLLKTESKTSTNHRKLLDDDEGDSEVAELLQKVESSEHDSEDESAAVHVPVLRGEEDEEEEEEEELAEVVDHKLRVPQRDAELIGMYATMRRNDLSTEVRKEVEEEVYRTIETKRKVDQHVTSSAEFLLMNSNGGLMSWLSDHMDQKQAESSSSNSNSNGGSDTTLVLMQQRESSSFHDKLQPFTVQVVYGTNGRPGPEGALVDNWDCLREMVKSWKSATNIWDNVAKRHTRYFANLCNAGVSPQDFARSLRRPQQQTLASSVEV